MNITRFVNSLFNMAFRKCPKIYCNRKNYHKTIRYLYKEDYRAFCLIRMMLTRVASLNDNLSQMKEIIRLSYNSFILSTNNECQRYAIFCRGILEDMNNITESSIDEKNRCLVLYNTFYD